MQYSQLIIYYFSGTGNAKNAASWIINVAKKNGLKTHLINIDRFESIEIPDLTEKTLIGFCFPTHGFNMPPLVIKFIRKFPKLKNNDVFILNTRGGLKLSKLFIPGLSGLAQFLPALILRLKGFRIVGMQPMDLPSNWLILHPGLRKKVVESIYQRCEGITEKFALRLLNGGKKYKAFLSLPFDIAVIPIAFAYYFIGRFFLAKTLIATDACNQCDICIKKCPVEAITKVNNRLFWTYRCESCMRCVNICPQRAIETAHSFVFLIILLFSLVFSPFIVTGLKSLGWFDFIYQSFLTRNVWAIIDWLLFLVVVFMSYGILHFFMRFKFVNRIFAYTSLSKYKFWRRYKAPKAIK